MKCSNFVIMFMFLTGTGSLHGARILGLFPHYGVSHWKVFEPLLEELDARGHQLVVVSPFRLTRNSSNYTHIDTSPMINQDGKNYVDFDRIVSTRQNAWFRQELLTAMAKDIEHTLGTPDVQTVLNSEFDVALIEVFNTEIFYALVHKLNLPAICLVSHAISPYINYIMSNPDHASFVPSIMSTVSIPMTSIIDRVQNTLEILLSKLAVRLFASSRSQIVAERILNESLPDLTTIARNSTALVLINSHFSLFGPTPFLPSVIEVGGLNVVPVKPLPEDLKKIMDKSTDGVIYFSMGSALDSGMSEEKRRDFIRVFSELNQTVLWKYGFLEDAPSNVHIKPWFPQRDVLAHTKCVLFISHCGLLSVNEAIVEAVPVVCIPIFADQPFNSKHLQATGMSVKIDYQDITYDSLKETIVKMITDPTVKAKAKELSAKFKDRPMSPLDTSVYWVEYVVRHRGAKHLLSPARHFYWFQFYNLDVAFIIVSIGLCTTHAAVKLILYLVRRILRLKYGSNTRHEKIKGS